MSTTAIRESQAAERQCRRDTFTLKFPGGQIAVLEVRGAPNENEARAIACEALPKCRYEVLDGDVTNGHAEVFYSWTDSTAQHHYPRRRWSTGQEALCS